MIKQERLEEICKILDDPTANVNKFVARELLNELAILSEQIDDDYHSLVRTAKVCVDHSKELLDRFETKLSKYKEYYKKYDKTQ